MKNLVILLAVFVFSISAFGQSSKGNCAPKFKAASLEDKNFDLNDLKGKVVLVTFWTTRCAPCVSGISRFNQLADEYKNQNVVFLAVTGENPETVKKFLRKKPFNFNIISNGLGVIMKFSGSSDGRVVMPTPTHYLINQEGEIEMK
ncbi:MAG TPA: TlpA disulfide reductase family protein, partial [Pyrinomonadaceae bacterium]|nr:TlpA disulfide reductase family protein [Pyrinomonadaceae bacterium]